MHVYTLLLLFIIGTACNGSTKKDLPKEKVSNSNILSVAHPKLVKTIGSPKYGNVQCGMQDKAGNLWFGTTENGLYKYDGKSFSQVLVADGLNSNNAYCILEDRDGKIWIGTEAGLCLYDGKRFTKIQIPKIELCNVYSLSCLIGSAATNDKTINPVAIQEINNMVYSPPPTILRKKLDASRCFQ